MVFCGMICVSIIEPDAASMTEAANIAPTDIVELRLDALSGCFDASFLKKIKKKKIVACMPSWEGGRFRGSEDERMKILHGSLPYVDYVTVELRTEKAALDALLKGAKELGVKVILSFHDFKETPDKEKIISILNDEKSAGADVAKVAFLAEEEGDVLRLMQAFVAARDDPAFKLPIIAVSMGEAGKISRVVAPLLGSFLTYAAQSRGKESAPGQLTFDEIKKIISVVE
jgi:3-dehydroquinate dehydratase type I